MIKPEKIFVAIDFKPSTDNILSYAVWFCKIMDCKRIILFHIMEYSLTPPAYLLPYINKEKKKIENKLQHLAEMLVSFSLNIDFKVVFGRLIESIKETIQDENAFAVMGFKTHITRPSTSERILKGLKVPTLIVKGAEFKEIKPDNVEIRKILCPVDFSDNSLRALNFAREIAKKCDAHLLALHVVPEHRVKGIIEDPEQIEEFVDYLKEEARQEFQKIDETLHYQVISGIPADEIIKKTKETDLVVIGSKGRSYAQAIIVGSVAETVIKNSSKPILLVP